MPENFAVRNRLVGAIAFLPRFFSGSANLTFIQITETLLESLTYFIFIVPTVTGVKGEHFQIEASARHMLESKELKACRRTKWKELGILKKEDFPKTLWSHDGYSSISSAAGFVVLAKNSNAALR